MARHEEDNIIALSDFDKTSSGPHHPFGAPNLNENTLFDFSSRGDYQDLNPSNSPRKIALIMSVTSHVLIFSFTAYIVYLSFKNHVLFSWHPTCMTIGTFLLMAEAIMAMSPTNSLSRKINRQGRVRLHFIIQACAAAFIFAGFLIIFINKNIHNKDHFQTWHSIFGLCTVILVAITASGGIAALYAISLKKWMKPSLVKFMHNAIGVLTFILGVVTLMLGLFSNWFYNNSSYTSQIICTIVVALAAIFSMESAIKSGYSRFKALFTPISNQ